MIAHSIFFYFFSIIAIFSSLMVITSRNTIHSVFFLILDFISVGCLFIMVGAEFLGMILLLSMIGAILLTFRQRKGVKKQSYFNQISRSPSTSVELKEVQSNKGVRIDD